MPLRFESLSARVVVVMMICATPALVVWDYISTRSAFSALSAANILLVEKVEKFDSDVAWAVVQQQLTSAIVLGKQAAQFEIDTKNRRANMNSWAASAARTAEKVERIDNNLEQFKAELRFAVAQTEDYGWLTKLTVYSIEAQVKEILRQIEVNRTSIKIASDQAVATHQKLNQKIVTQPEADQLKKQAEALKQQNRELRRKKAKPIFKLFIDQPTTE